MNRSRINQSRTNVLTGADQRKAFFLRIKPSGINRLREALEKDQIIIGWANALGLLDEKLDMNAFKDIIRNAYENSNSHQVGQFTGHMWRFIREMKPGDLVVVPSDSSVYFAEITGDAFFLEEKQKDDTSYRRPVKWLNDKESIPKDITKNYFSSKFGQGTSGSPPDLLKKVEACLQVNLSDKTAAANDTISQQTFHFQSGHNPRNTPSVSHQEERYSLVSNRHNVLQQALYDELCKEYGSENVGTEQTSETGGYIDVVVKHKEEYIFFEIKDAQSTQQCIREAIGQLLEYAYWPGTQRASSLIIVGEAALDDCNKKYLDYLSANLSIPVTYKQVVL